MKNNIPKIKNILNVLLAISIFEVKNGTPLRISAAGKQAITTFCENPNAKKITGINGANLNLVNAAKIHPATPISMKINVINESSVNVILPLIVVTSKT